MEGSFLEGQEWEVLVSVSRPFRKDPELDLVDVQSLADGVNPVRGLLNVVSVYEHSPTQVGCDS